MYIKYECTFARMKYIWNITTTHIRILPQHLEIEWHQSFHAIISWVDVCPYNSLHYSNNSNQRTVFVFSNAWILRLFRLKLLRFENYVNSKKRENVKHVLKNLVDYIEVKGSFWKVATLSHNILRSAFTINSNDENEVVGMGGGVQKKYKSLDCVRYYVCEETNQLLQRVFN